MKKLLLTAATVLVMASAPAFAQDHGGRDHGSHQGGSHQSGGSAGGHGGWDNHGGGDRGDRGGRGGYDRGDHGGWSRGLGDHYAPQWAYGPPRYRYSYPRYYVAPVAPYGYPPGYNYYDDPNFSLSFSTRR